MGYWDETDRIIAENGGRNPTCPNCGKEMFPQDDHGRFVCSCKSPFDDFLQKLSVPQVPADVILTDEQKREILPINRLHLPPTKEERDFFKEAFDEMFGEIKRNPAKKMRMKKKRKRKR